ARAGRGGAAALARDRRRRGCRAARPLLEAFDGDHVQARRALAQLLRRLVGLRLVEPPGGFEVVELEQDEAGRAPVSLEDGQLTAAGEEAAAAGGDRAGR